MTLPFPEQLAVELANSASSKITGTISNMMKTPSSQCFAAFSAWSFKLRGPVSILKRQKICSQTWIRIKVVQIVWTGSLEQLRSGLWVFTGQQLRLRSSVCMFVKNPSLKWIIIPRNCSSQSPTEAFCCFTPPAWSLARVLTLCCKSALLKSTKFLSCGWVVLFCESELKSMQHYSRLKAPRCERELCGFRLLLWHCGSFVSGGGACMRSVLRGSLVKILWCVTSPCAVQCACHRVKNIIITQRIYFLLQFARNKSTWHLVSRAMFRFHPPAASPSTLPQNMTQHTKDNQPPRPSLFTVFTTPPCLKVVLIFTRSRRNWMFMRCLFICWLWLLIQFRNPVLYLTILRTGL